MFFIDQMFAKHGNKNHFVGTDVCKNQSVSIYGCRDLIVSCQGPKLPKQAEVIRTTIVVAEVSSNQINLLALMQHITLLIIPRENEGI